MARLRHVAVLAACLSLMIAAGPDASAADRALSIDPDRTMASTDGRRFGVVTVGSPDSCAPGARREDACDHLAVSVEVDPAYWGSHVGGLQLAIGWSNFLDDFDLYLYDATGRLVAIAASAGTTGEQLFLARATGTYEARVVPVTVTNAGYRASAILQSAEDGGASVASSFTFGPDRANWYWKDQREQRGSLPTGGTTAIRRASPQARDTIPIAVRDGRQHKSAAVRFDLTYRGVTGTRDVASVILTIQEQGVREAKEDREDPPVEASKHSIKACRVKEQWGPGEAELWKLRPAADPSGCAVGTRRGSSWVFDLTAMARLWGRSPSSSLGVLLTGVTDPHAPRESWQINLKLPAMDDPATALDEYEATANRAVIEVGLGGPEGSNGTPSGSQGGLAPVTAPTATAGGGGASEAPDPIAVDGAEGVGVPAPEPFAIVAAPEGVARREPVATVPSLPWYAWALLPLALVAVVAARSALTRSPAGSAPGGAISEIRRQFRRVEQDRPDVPPARSEVQRSVHGGMSTARGHPGTGP